MNILLHICCGVCAAGAVDRLQKEGHTVTGFFFNPNIFPEEEYKKRLEAARKIAVEMGFPLVEGGYDHAAWLNAVRGYEGEKEGGLRCLVCFKTRLAAVHDYFVKRGDLDHFTTTLTIGPMKDAESINKIGEAMDKKRFLPVDFKKKDGFKRAMEIAKKLNLYCQRYCGCEFSKK